MKTNQEKQTHLTGVTVSNFKGLDLVEARIDGKVYYVVGANGSGKSSLLDAILYALQNDLGVLKKDRYRLIGKHGNSAKAVVTLYDAELDTEVTVSRRITKTTDEVEITTKNGAVLDISYLKDMLDAFTSDVIRFIEMKPEEQALLLGIDTKSFDDRIKEAKNELSVANKVKLQAMRRVDDMGPTEKVEPVNIAELVRTRDTVSERINSMRYTERRIQELTEQINRCSEELANLSGEQQELKESFDPDLLKALHSINTETTTRISSAQETNTKAAKYEQYIIALKEVERTKALWDSANKNVSNIEEERNAYLQSKKLPYDNIAISDSGGLMVQDKKGEQFRPLSKNTFNTARAAQIAISLLLTCNKPRMPLFFIKGGGLFDRDESGRIPLFEELKGMGAQFIVEVVAKDKPEAGNSILLSQTKEDVVV